MANEILKDEQLTDEQLEQVAGGNTQELDKDIAFFQDIGLFPKNDSNNVSMCIDPNSIANIFASAGVQTIYTDRDNPNIYKINGKNVSRREALQHVLDVKHMRTNLDKYM